MAGLIFGTAVSGALGFGAGRALMRRQGPVTRHQRGAIVEDAPAGDSQGADATVPTLAGRAIPDGDECKHFKIIGTTGTGKSTAICELLGPALRRGDRLVIADPDGGYLRRFYDASRGDVILNPFDARSVRWNPFGEVRRPYDAEQLVRSLLPDPEAGDSTWCGYARTLLTAVIRQAHLAGVREPGELYRLIVIAPVSELRSLVAGTPAQPFFEEHNVRMLDSIRSVASSAAASFEHIAAQQGPAFSVRDWVGRQGNGVLFMPYRADQIAALRSTVSAWMRIAIFETMAGAERDQRLWFVIDELDALGKIDGLKDALARVRKFGGRCILGFQSVAQVASTYGAGDAHTLVENCGSTLILRCSASEGGGTSKFASTLIGQREVMRASWSRTRRMDELFGSETHSQHLSIEPAVMAAQIEQLPDLGGYLKFASEQQWRRVALRRPTPVGADIPAFVPVPPPVVAIPITTPARRGIRPGAPVRAPRTRGAAKQVARTPPPSPDDSMTGPAP
jgi:type IV secretory pathway TraG/TraD family ATPase VirD4